MAYRIRNETVAGLAAVDNPAPIESMLWYDQAECTEIPRVGGKNAGSAMRRVIIAAIAVAAAAQQHADRA